MQNDYGSLRRRTSDASWQWLLMGTILGLGFALVACVGGYALGALSFPLLEDNTATPQVRIAPNETEVALQALAAQQTLEAASDALNIDEPADTETDTSTPAETPADDTPAAMTASPLPDGNDDMATGGQEGASVTAEDQNPPAVLNPTATLQADQPAAQTESLGQETPVVGTPPGGESAQALSLPEAPAIPPELDAIKTEMVEVTGGTFQMGTTLEEGMQAMDECATYGKVCDDPNWISDSIPPHQTTVDSFEMEIYEVSLQQYVTFLNWLGPNEHRTGCGGNPCIKTTQEEPNSLVNFDGETYSIRNPDFYANHPVTNVTWWGAREYCQTLNRRLPTEAEWERAARGPQNYIYPWGFEYNPQLARSSLSDEVGTMPIDSFASGASPYGIFNMAGNVSEWVFDWYQVDYYTQMANNPEPNPRGPAAGTEKVIRGGSWDTIPLFLRAVHRMSQRPDEPIASIGFRCVADITSNSPLTAPDTTTQSGTASEDTAPGGAPTLAPAPTRPPAPTPTVTAGPTATLAPG